MYLFKWLFLKVQHFQTQLKRGWFFEDIQKKLHFLVITVEINHISSVYQHELLMFHMMSHVLMVVLFVKQNIFKLHSSKITPVRQKQAMCETII